VTTQVGPMTIAAHNSAQAEYLVRSRAQQRGVNVRDISIEDAGTGSWFVTVTVDDEDAARLAEAALDQDTTVMHFRNHPHRSPPES
jgi:hypothetical protein